MTPEGARHVSPHAGSLRTPKPRYLLIENVVGFELSDTRETLRRILADECGYAIQAGSPRVRIGSRCAPLET